MPNALRSGLADLGRASPALSRTWSDIMGENRARRQEAVQGEEMALRREKFQQEKAISDVTLQKEQMALEAQKKKEAWLDEPMDITTHPTFMGLSQETQNKVKQDFSTQKVTDASGRGTRRNILGHIDMMEKTPKLLDSYLTVEMNARHDDVLKANEDLQKELQKPDADPQKVSKLQATFDVTNQKYTGLMKNRKDYTEAMQWKASIDATTGEIKRLQSEGKLGQMPEALKQSMFMALRTGDLKTVNDVLKEWAKSELKSEKKVERTVDLGNKVEYIYTDGTREMKPKGKLPGDEGKEARTIGKDAAGLRKEFNALKEVKDFKDVQSKIQVMEKALSKSQKGGSMVAVDQALITLFNKMTDPQSVVRESEYVRTPQNMALLNQIQGKIEKIRKGGAGLTDEERNALVSMGREFMGVYQNLYNQSAEEYRGYASQSKIDPDMVISKQKKDSLGIR